MNLWGESQSLIINQSSALLGILDLTGYAAPFIGVVGHSEVPLWYDRYIVEQGTIFPGYSGSGSSGGSSATLATAASLVLSSDPSGATGPQGAYNSPSSVRLGSPSPVEVASPPIDDLSERRPMTDASRNRLARRTKRLWPISSWR